MFSSAEVYVVVWDDPTSTKPDGMMGGMMGTSDEATRVFCEKHGINFDKHKRITYYDGYSMLSNVMDMHLTHHQKLVVFDKEQLDPKTAGPAKKRGLKAYWGGLDLTNGRFDTPEHHLFKYNEVVFEPNQPKNELLDFYNNCVKRGADVTLGGPRQPWHDIHGCVEGPIAWDFLVNFIERINVQSNQNAVYPSGGKKMTMYKKFKSNLDRLIEQDQQISYGYRHLRAVPNLFHSQMFRSICYKSAFHSRSPYEKYQSYRYKFPSDRVVDHSIQNAYIYQISRAKRFIYFENQYWVGSSFSWLDCKKAPSHHRIPDTVVRTICERIDEGKDFHVYINIPLFPEGLPGDAAVQEILHLQYQTCRMMATRVSKHLESNGGHPSDWRKYLSFFFMGKNEPSPHDGSDSTTDSPNKLKAADKKGSRLSSGRSSSREAGDVLDRVKVTRRHPIYIHSKFFVVDDEYALLGSANVNERSMCGIRDTEIAIGLWQPNFLTKKSGNGVSLPTGYVSEMRRHLWQELIGEFESCVSDPGSPECVELVRKRAMRNRELYWDDNHVDYLPYGFMCEYPYTWDSGKKDLIAYSDGTFPDFCAPVCGKVTAISATMAVTG
eukprot:GHVH01010949.1.p1 GENE.GHVH01010949.1~~GHVH01010949.1.p1  ORF type:complete len:606 (+),score=88.45 GHVH01010949.1:960-2777(+)